MDASLFQERFAHFLSNPLALLFPDEQDGAGPIGAGAHGSTPSTAVAAVRGLLEPPGWRPGTIFWKIHFPPTHGVLGGAAQPRQPIASAMSPWLPVHNAPRAA